MLGTRSHEVGELREVTMRVVYDTTVEDLGEAVTTADRIARWFLPVSGDLRLGGTYQLEGNAGGEITACDPPNGFDATWVYRAPDLAEPALSWSCGPSSVLAVGIGWDQGLLGLTLPPTRWFFGG